MDLVIERRAARGNEITDLAMHPVLRRAYAARGVCDSQELALTLDRLMPVGTLDSVDAAVALILEHRERRILVVGDFDADGATSTALIVRCLRAWGFASVDFLVPNRFEFGYGLTPEIVGLAAERNPSLIITVDNGISSNAGVAAARARGIQVLVTDHHLPGASLPDADVIVNPNVPGSRFGSRALAGVGVAFYVMAAVRREIDARGTVVMPPVTDFLDLVALGTVADLVPLDVNNRVLVAQGIRRIRAGRAVPGIRALLEIGKRSVPALTAADLGFTIGPRLNAAGRLDDMSIGIRCLLADTEAEALALAARLDQLNVERREIEARMQGVALAAVKGLRDPDANAPTRHGVCLFDADWHQGVVGLVASRIKDRVRRPVIAFARNADGTLARIGALGSRHPHSRRARRHRRAASRAHQPFRRPRDGRGTVARGATPRCVRARVRSGGGALARSVHSVESRRDRRRAHERRDRARNRAGAARRRSLGPGVSRAVLRRRVRDQERPRGGRQTSQDVGHHGAISRATSMPSRSTSRAATRIRALPDGDVRLVYRLDINEYKGERRLQLLVDHVLP